MHWLPDVTLHHRLVSRIISIPPFPGLSCFRGISFRSPGKQKDPVPYCRDRIRSSCGATPLDANASNSVYAVTYRRLITERRSGFHTSRRFPVALRSPFDQAFCPRSHRPRLSVQKRYLMYLRFFNGFLINSTDVWKSQRLYILFYAENIIRPNPQDPTPAVPSSPIRDTDP